MHPWMRGFPPAPNHPQAPLVPQNSASAESCAVRVMVTNVTGDEVRLCVRARVYVCMCVRGWVGRWGCVCACVCVCVCVCVCCHPMPRLPKHSRVGKVYGMQ